jgi:hypothetical protein
MAVNSSARATPIAPAKSNHALKIPTRFIHI